MKRKPTDSSVAVIGGGINGIALAWCFAEHGYRVTLFERGKLASETSSASTKLLHGGLRYLESASFGLVREALLERSWWLNHAPGHTHSIPLCLPVYKDAGRSRWRIKCGLWIYDRLAGSLNLAPHRWLDRTEIIQMVPDIKRDDLTGGYLFYEGQMDDYRLALWAAEQARDCGATLREDTAVQRIDSRGHVWLPHDHMETFDLVINAAGPWAEALLKTSGLHSRYGLDLVRGSHLVLPGTRSAGVVLQHPDDGRVFFVLPHQGQTLLGTTEVPQDLDQIPACSSAEQDYLLAGYNAHFDRPLTVADIEGSYSGLRPLVRSCAAPNRASREYALERQDRLITVWGGKWTTARSLARKVLAGRYNAAASV